MPTPIEKIYNDHIRSLSTAEQLKLLQKIAQEVADRTPADPSTPEVKWSDVKGTLKGATNGEDAQAYITRTRKEADRW